MSNSCPTLFDTRAASGTADTDEFRAHLAGLAVVAEVPLAACAVLTDIASAADLLFGAVRTLLSALGADGGAVHTSVAADADFHAVFTDTALGAIVALAADAFEADPALSTDFIVRAVHAFVGAFGADFGTIRATAAVSADLIHAVFAQATLGAVVALAAHTVKANTTFGAKLIVSARLAFLAAFGTDYGTL